MRNGPISDQARLLAAVSELDSSPAPAMRDAAHALTAVADTLVPSEYSTVCLGEGGGGGINNVEVGLDGQHVTELHRWSASVRGHEHPVIAVHDATGLLVIGRRADIGSCRPEWPTFDLSTYWRPFRFENMVGAPVGFPNDHAYLASLRAGRGYSDGEVRLLDRLRPVASRLLRRSAVSSLAGASTRAWGLSPREAEVFAFVGVGLSLPSVASILGLSVGTVRTHLGKAYTKSGVRSRAAATSALLDVEPTALREAGRRFLPGEPGLLTRQELAVLRTAATGRTTSAIASVTGVSMETAKTHLANAYRKLGVQNRSQALLLLGTARVSTTG